MMLEQIRFEESIDCAKSSTRTANDNQSVKASNDQTDE
jgi:hypothetical protein